MIKNEIIRRSVRLISAIQELHKEGYQNLAVYTGMSGSDYHWRLSLMPFDCLCTDERGEVINVSVEEWQVAHHSSDQTGNAYFGWEGVSNLNARELAQMIKSKLPRLVEYCRGVNFEYAGWFNYIHGQAEKEILPVMYADYYGATKGSIASTHNQSLIAPPYSQVNNINGRLFIYAKGNKLTTDRRDWHLVYRQIIDDIRDEKIAKFPYYPIDSDNHLEFCAYWEGAIYYIDQILKIHRIDEFLLKADDVSRSSESWSSFFAIYNTHGQFIYLKAFLIRCLLNDKSEKYLLKRAELVKWKKWLVDFEDNYTKPLNFNATLPNPYFGGSNPLHLGGILEPEVKAGKETLLSLY
jgi:hypothetical protein